MLTLPNNSHLPPIGFGTSVGVPDEEELAIAIDAAIEAGFRHIDTAFIYFNEKIIGKVLQKWFQSGKLKREEIFITTKLPIGGVYPDGVDKFLRQSLSNLQLDYIDLYLIHIPLGCVYQEGKILPVRDENGHVVLRGKTDHVGIWKKMEEQVDAKRARYIGLSNYTVPQIETILTSARIRPACLQIEVHLFFQQRPLVEFCERNGIVVVGFSPLGAADFNKRMKKISLAAEEQPLPDLFGNATVKKIAQKYSKSVAQVMLKFLIQIGVIPIPKSINPVRIKENFDIFDFELSEDDVATLRGLDVGESARITNFSNIFKGIEKHPDYPF